MTPAGGTGGSAAAPSPFPPIADYGFLSDCHTGALVAPDGAIDWLCVPSFDSPSVFGALLDRPAGLFRVGPRGVTVPDSRVYEPGTTTRLNTWRAPGGCLVVLGATTRFWRDWLSRARIPDHRWRAPLQRSALAIKGLTYMPTGATVAALTTSLPETPGGERNWDYRYTWMRDSTFTLQALHWLTLDWEADEFMQFVADIEPNDDGALQIMYGIDGHRDLTESFREELSGYSGARPVRIGNGAYDQRQNDVFGAVLDSILKHTVHSQRLPRRLWPIVQAQAECATQVWRQPDQGIWEARGKPQHYVSSKLMCWVALDRAAKLAQIRGDAALAAGWRQTATEIKADILDHGVDKRGVLRQHYATDALDASTLLAAILGFWPGNDKRLRASVLAIADELSENGFVLRYRTGETDDGLSGKEGTFVICSFWLVSALAIIGEMRRAREQMQRLVKVASPLELYAEEFDTDTGRHLGNFPQAFSHLALVEAASRIIVAERLAEINA